MAVGREHVIPVQQADFQNAGNGGAVLPRRGVEVALLAYPTRYTHSPIETVDEGDIRASMDHSVAFITDSRLS